MIEIGSIVSILILATIAEAIVEYFVAPVVKPLRIDAPEAGNMDAVLGGIDWRSLILRYAAAAIAIVLCLVYEADLLALLGLNAGWSWIGQVVTGILVGRGSNFINDFADRWLT